MKSILAAWRQADKDQRDVGAQWYPRARQVAEQVATAGGISLVHAVAVIAHLSPRVQWSRNVTGALDLVTTGNAVGMLGASVNRARGALASDDPLGTINGPKTRSFAANILGDLDQVTVDVWAARIAGVDQGLVKRQAGYDQVVSMYRKAARKIGVEPAVLQATTWIVARGREE